jgi:pimeloyl-ACP methyl ester carboxylesterase
MNVAAGRDMGLLSTLTGITRFGIDLSRNALSFGERITPWPLSIVPRTMRLPLDVAATVAAHLGGSAETTDADRPSPPAEERAPAHAAPATKRAEPRAARRTAAAPVDPPPEVYTEPRTATIAGARSDGPDDTPEYDREFRARQAPLYVRDAGTGPALVLLHAFPLNSRMWEPQLKSLSNRFRVIAPDFAGFGLSWAPDATLSLADQARAVELTLDDLGVDELVLVGLSMGGYVALPLLRRLGPRVRGLVLAHTRATADDARTIDDRHRLAAEVDADGVDVAAQELLPKLLGTSTTRDRPELVDHVHALVLENKEPGVAGALRAMASRRDATPLLASIACPVLVIAGSEDTLVTPTTARSMATRIPDARLDILRAGHLSNLEASADFDRALADFARSVHGATRTTARARGASA